MRLKSLMRFTLKINYRNILSICQPALPGWIITIADENAINSPLFTWSEKKQMLLITDLTFILYTFRLFLLGKASRLLLLVMLNTKSSADNYEHLVPLIHLWRAFTVKLKLLMKSVLFSTQMKWRSSFQVWAGTHIGLFIENVTNKPPSHVWIPKNKNFN